MDIMLWVLQVLLAIAFFLAGVNHAFRYDQIKPRMNWVAAVPRGLVTFIGICEILGAVGLILPAVTSVWPWLTPLAALGLAAIMLLAAGFHATRSEYSSIITNLILLVLAAFLAYGRWMIQPF